MITGTINKYYGGFMNKNGKMTVEEAGSKGGRTRAEKYSQAELSEQAKRGARTIEQQRPGFHSQIGKKGGRARSSNKDMPLDQQESNKNK